jgi:hypothetical protein
VTDHLEELQRKCLKHERKPLSKMLLEEIKAAEAAEKAEKEKKEKVDDGDEAPAEEKEKEKETKGKDRADRDWRRTGGYLSYTKLNFTDFILKMSVGSSGLIPRLRS